MKQNVKVNIKTQIVNALFISKQGHWENIDQPSFSIK